ncbi:replication initiation protein [Bacillus cereus]|uniref:replication initiation protein n=1 Tax=Bacillus cereus TaxID=1396 RepID=UPI0018CCE658|nr:replication initiation protein [Bacillus cereus]MBG9615448.1 initiator RepB protein [Bacillus cereus]
MLQKQRLQIKEHNIVSKSNVLIEASSRLNLIEQKILLCLASNIEPADRDFKIYTFPIKQFHELLGLNGATKYTELSGITKDLLSKVIEIRTKEGLMQLSWVSSVIYNKNKGTMDIRFDPLLKPFLLELSSQFTSYRLGNVMQLKSTYSIRIYELLKQYEDLKERVIYLDDLRYYLDALNIYPKYANFKQRVLNVSQQELKLKTDIFFEFEEIKLGRKVQKIKFIIKSKKSVSGTLENNWKNTSCLDGFEQKIKYFEESCNQKVYPAVFDKWKNHPKEVLDIIESIRFRTDIKMPIAYVERGLNNLLDKKKKENLENSKITELIQKTLDMDSILFQVIEKYSNSTGTVATFLVKDAFINIALEYISLEKAEQFWKSNEEIVMQKIYRGIRKNRKKKY